MCFFCGPDFEQKCAPSFHPYFIHPERAEVAFLQHDFLDTGER